MCFQRPRGLNSSYARGQRFADYSEISIKSLIEANMLEESAKLHNYDGKS